MPEDLPHIQALGVNCNALCSGTGATISGTRIQASLQKGSSCGLRGEQVYIPNGQARAARSGRARVLGPPVSHLVSPQYSNQLSTVDERLIAIVHKE